MHKQYFCYGLCGAIALRGIILPDWTATVSLAFAIVLCGFWMWIEHKTIDDKSGNEIKEVKTELKEVSSRLSSLSLKLGIKK